MKKFQYILILTVFVSFLYVPTRVRAAAQIGTCTSYPGQKVSDMDCERAGGIFTLDTVAPSTIDAGAKIDNPFKTGGNLVDLFKAILNNVILPVGAVASVLAFVYSGFLYVKAQGNETELKTAHKALLYTVVGTVVLIGAAVIADVIGNTINQLR